MDKLYKFTGNSFIPLNHLQKKTLNELKSLTGKKLFYEKNNCICNKKDSLLISETCRYGLEVHYKLCKFCGLVRQDPILNESSLKLFYKKFYRKLYTGKNNTDNIKKIFNAQFESGKKYYQIITKELKKKNLNIKNYKNVLEIGSSCGGILAFFMREGHKVHAMDYDKKYLNFAYISGIKKIYDSFEKIHERFDLIILSHTFEHFRDLKKNIHLINRLLNNNGLIFFDLPGIFNFEYYQFKNIFYNIKRVHFLFHLQNAHTYYFTKDSFIYFLKNLNIFNIIFINEKINCLVQKDNKNNSIRLKKFNYNKINNFLIINNLRYRILLILHFLLYPLIKLIRIVKKI
jgi:2-polyprenyl-3-methyl-5-hydroxy-6-metoxy-1,4-benzoquinol methylase